MLFKKYNSSTYTIVNGSKVHLVGLMNDDAFTWHHCNYALVFISRSENVFLVVTQYIAKGSQCQSKKCLF